MWHINSPNLNCTKKSSCLRWLFIFNNTHCCVFNVRFNMLIIDPIAYCKSHSVRKNKAYIGLQGNIQFMSKQHMCNFVTTFSRWWTKFHLRVPNCSSDYITIGHMPGDKKCTRYWRGLLNQCWFNVGPVVKRMAQRLKNIGSMPRVCCGKD